MGNGQFSRTCQRIGLTDNGTGTWSKKETGNRNHRDEKDKGGRERPRTEKPALRAQKRSSKVRSVGGEMGRP